MLTENNLYIIVMYDVITVNYCKCMLLLHNTHSHKHPHSHNNSHNVSRNLATGGNNKILRTPPPHIRSSNEILPPPSPNSEQINHPFSNHTYKKLTPNHIHLHNAPFVTLTHTTHIISSAAPTYASQCHP